MSKETLNAEEFMKSDAIWQMITSHDDIKKIICQFAEAYHLAKINSISDEEIVEQSDLKFGNGRFLTDLESGFRSGARWFKNRLLKVR